MTVVSLKSCRQITLESLPHSRDHTKSLDLRPTRHSQRDLVACLSPVPHGASRRPKHQQRLQGDRNTVPSRVQCYQLVRDTEGGEASGWALFRWMKMNIDTYGFCSITLVESGIIWCSLKLRFRRELGLDFDTSSSEDGWVRISLYFRHRLQRWISS